MGVRRTKERIALTFTWPSLINDVIKFCRECAVCQKRARATYRDRVPIQGGVVSMEPVFSHFYVCLLYTSPSPRDGLLSRMPSSA